VKLAGDIQFPQIGPISLSDFALFRFCCRMRIENMSTDGAIGGSTEGVGCGEVAKSVSPPVQVNIGRGEKRPSSGKVILAGGWQGVSVQFVQYFLAQPTPSR
jgi:hypothetical protein